MGHVLVPFSHAAWRGTEPLGLRFYFYSHLFSGHAMNVHGFYCSRTNCMKFDTQPLDIQWVMFWYPSCHAALWRERGLWAFISISIAIYLVAMQWMSVHGFYCSRTNCMKFDTQPLDIQWVMFWYPFSHAAWRERGLWAFVSISIAIYLVAMQWMSMASIVPDQIAWNLIHSL